MAKRCQEDPPKHDFIVCFYKEQRGVNSSFQVARYFLDEFGNLSDQTKRGDKWGKSGKGRRFLDEFGNLTHQTQDACTKWNRGHFTSLATEPAKRKIRKLNRKGGEEGVT